MNNPLGSLVVVPMPLHPPDIEDRVVLSRYPMLPQGSQHIKDVLNENGVTVVDLIEAPWLEEVRTRGRLRLLESVMHKDGVDDTTTVDLSSDAGKMTETLSFLHAMLVVCASFDERLLSRWIEGEASRADGLFGRDASNFTIICLSFFSNIKLEQEGEDIYWVPVSDFIELCPKISGSYWRLANRPVKDGWVRMDPASGENSRERTSRLLKERVRSYLDETCRERMEKMTDEFAAQFSEAVERITGVLALRVKEEMPVSAAVREDWPPCFESAISELNQGVNVNHVGRVFLASFSKAIGHTVEQTCGFFSGAPDYNPDTTSYQVSHVYEGDYTPNGCASLKTNARCPVQPGDDRLCDQEWLTHPLKYIRAKQRRRYSDSGEAKITT